MDEIRQNGKTVLYSEDGRSIPMFFNNLTGKNFSGKEYERTISDVSLWQTWDLVRVSLNFAGTVRPSNKVSYRM